MANKPIITIPIDDKQFNNFVERFESLEKKINALPDSWKAVNEATKSANDDLAEGIWTIVEYLEMSNNQARALSEHLKAASDAQGQFTTATREGETGLKKMAREAKELGDSIFGIGKFLLKIGAIGIGSITGGLFGIDKLGESAVANQRSARMMGLTTGQYRAFDTDLGRDVGDSTLQHVIDAQHDLTKQFYLAHATGLSRNQISSMDAGTLAAMLSMAENAYIKAHPGWNMQSIQAAGFTQLGEGQSDLLLHGNTPLSEQQRALMQYRRDSGQLNYGASTVDALYDFTNRLHIAGQRIETDFSDKLSELNRDGALSRFITSLEKDAEILFNGIFTEQNLTAMQTGLTKVATYLGSPEFQKAIGTLSEDLINLAQWVAKALGIVSPDTGTKTSEVPLSVSDAAKTASGAWGNGLGFENPDHANPQGFPYSNFMTTGGLFSRKDVYEGPYFSAINPHTAQGSQNLGKLQNLEQQYHEPAGLLASTVFLESSGNKKAVNPTTGAAGPFQFMEGTGRQYGITNPFDFDQEAQGAARYYADLLKMFNGDIRKALAAYDWGQGNVQKDVGKYGASWEQHVPKETENRIVTALMMMSKYKPNKTVVTVNNPAGANVAVSTNAAAP